MSSKRPRLRLATCACVRLCRSRARAWVAIFARQQPLAGSLAGRAPGVWTEGPPHLRCLLYRPARAWLVPRRPCAPPSRSSPQCCREAPHRRSSQAPSVTPSDDAAPFIAKLSAMQAEENNCGDLWRVRNMPRLAANALPSHRPQADHVGLGAGDRKFRSSRSDQLTAAMRNCSSRAQLGAPRQLFGVARTC